MKRLLLTGVLLGAAGFFLAAAQSVSVKEKDLHNEGRAHLTAGLSYKPVKGLSLSLHEQFRLKDNFTAIDRLNTDVEVGYKVCPYFRLGASYRFMAVCKQDDEEVAATWNFRHRAAFHVAGLYTVGRWHLSLREKFQSTWRDESVTNLLERPIPALYLRTRFKVEYHCFSHPLQPYLSVECYSPLNQTDYLRQAEQTSSYRHWAFDQLDTRLGLEWRLDAHNFLDFYYRLDASRRVDVGANSGKIRITPVLDHIAGVAYCYRF